MAAGDDWPDVLPRSLVPLPDESLPGFVLRICHRLDLVPGRLMRKARLTGRGVTSSNGAPARHLLLLETGPLEAFARLTRLSTEEAQALTLAQFTGRHPAVGEALAQPGAVRRRPVTTVLPGLLLNSSRYCPRCLAGDGSEVQQRHGGPWKLHWRLATVFACLHHRVLLEHLCPDCRHPAFSTGGWTNTQRLLPAQGTPGLHPAQCRAGLDRDGTTTICGRRLDAVTARPLPEPFAALQRKILDFTTPEDGPARPDAVGDLQIMAAIVAGTWPLAADQATFDLPPGLDDLLSPSGTAKDTIRCDEPPADAGATAALLAVADAILDQPRAAVRQHLDRFLRSAGPRSDRHWGTTWTRLPTRCSPTTRQDILLVADQLRQPARKQHADPPAAPVLAVAQRGYLPEHIPQHIPGAWVNVLFDNGAQKSLRACQDRRFRRAVSVQLVQAATGLPYAEATRFLDIPAAWLDRNDLMLRANAYQQHAQRARRAELAEALEALAKHVARTPAPTDYHQRRNSFAFWNLRPTQWQTILEHLPPPPEEHPVHPGSPLHLAASAHIWSALTGSEWDLAPCFRPPLSSERDLPLFKTDRTQQAALELLHTPAEDAFLSLLRQALDDCTRSLLQHAGQAPAEPASDSA
ncbi:TniQ family protein [Kitasatospora purpeofusca]|uniref:TniQ family protein n=1 Tax=Kitasatospora purpeofusca TaxID=67352 RepID=UPI0035DF8EC6